MDVNAIPPHTAPKYFILFLKLNEKNTLTRYWINAPTGKATATDSKIPEIMANAFEELMNCAMSIPSAPLKITLIYFSKYKVTSIYHTIIILLKREWF